MEYITVRQTWNGAVQKAAKKVNYNSSSRGTNATTRDIVHGENAPSAIMLRDKINRITNDLHAQGVPSYDVCKATPGLASVWN